jgi:serine/threonine-protein kinase
LRSAVLHSQKETARSAALGYVAWLLFAPVGIWMGARDWLWGGVCDLLFLASAGASWYVARARDGRTARAADLALLTSTLAIVVSVGVVGPFMLLPGIAAVNTILYVATAERSRRPWAIAAGCLGVLLPFALEIAGVFPPAFAFEGGALVALPQILAFPRVPTLVFLLATNLSVILVASLFVARFRDTLHATQERLTFQTWQLRQFVPGEAYGAVASPSVAPPPPAPKA